MDVCIHLLTGHHAWLFADCAPCMATRAQVKAVDTEIFQAVRQQSGTTTRSRQDLGVASGQIAELFAKVGALAGEHC